MPFFVYLLHCVDGSYYAGHTENVESRLASHQEGLVPGYTQSRRPVSLVWVEETSSRAEALQVERQIKGWSRAKKRCWLEVDGKRCEDRHAWARIALPRQTGLDLGSSTTALWFARLTTNGVGGRSGRGMHPGELLADELEVRSFFAGRDPRGGVLLRSW